MRPSRLFGIGAPFFGALGQVVLAQQPGIAIRPLGATIATSADSIGNNASYRILSDGRVLVNDLSNRRLLLLDATLQHGVIVADTTSRTAKAYGGGLPWMVPFTGDSSLLLDRITDAFLVVDPQGKVARIIRKPAAVGPALGGVAGMPLGFDRTGHLLFRAAPPVFLSLLDPEFVGDTLMVGPDSTAVLREDVATRRLDTLVMVQAARLRQAVTRRGNGLGGFGRPAINPIPAGDEWTVLNEGSVAILRVHDFRVDWVGTDRRIVQGPKIPAPLMRLTESMKVAIMDSVRARDSALAAGRGAPMPNAPPRAYVQPSDLPDYYPPFTMGSARADADGNVWVAENRISSTPGSVVYDVISRAGGLIDRVRIPIRSTLVGFGPGVAYVASFVGGTVQLARVRVR